MRMPGLRLEEVRRACWPHRPAAAWSPRRRRWVCARCGLRLIFHGTTPAHRLWRRGMTPLYPEDVTHPGGECPLHGTAGDCPCTDTGLLTERDYRDLGPQ